MDCAKTGKLIKRLRLSSGMTQAQLAHALNISDKTVSKWERGLGCPDVSLLGELSECLGVNIERLLCGDLNINDIDGGNMKNIKFYVCPDCGSVVTSMGGAEVSCCGRKLSALEAKPEQGTHSLEVQNSDGEFYVTFTHEMTKTHFITFVASVAYDRVTLVRLYPEQSGELRIPNTHGGKLYFYCNKHGLFVSE